LLAKAAGGSAIPDSKAIAAAPDRKNRYVMRAVPHAPAPRRGFGDDQEAHKIRHRNRLRRSEKAGEERQAMA